MLYLIGTIVAIIIFFLLYGIWENTNLKVEKYEIKSSKIKKYYSFVLLADLHGCRFGKDNEKLLSQIQALQPDFICIAGDMVVKNGKKNKTALAIIRKLVKDYPVYYAPGNHEIRIPNYEKYQEALALAGVHYLKNESQIAQTGIRITGLDLEEDWYHKFWNPRDMDSEVLPEHLGACPSDVFTILLAHNPEYFPMYASWGADLTLSGHIHGGIARLPIVGGVISPSLRLFPTYDAGEFEKDGHHMILSRGLGLHHIRLRFFNRPELSKISLRPKQENT